MTNDNKQQKPSDSTEPAIAYSTCYGQYGINILSLFDGMSCGQLALQKVGLKVNNYFASEIDEKAMFLYHFTSDNKVWIEYIKNCSGEGYLFKGIIKNKSELKRILSQIGIYEQ
jgi:hypothetical protein